MAFEWKCKKCGCEILTTTEKVFSNGVKHISAMCTSCGKHAGYAPQNLAVGDFVVSFGKHNGKTLDQIYAEDPGYILWAARDFKSSVLRDKFRVFLDNIDTDRGGNDH